jgi:hypothetical protein
MEDAIHGGGLAPQHTMRVYYTGSDKLLEGYALCFNFDAIDVVAENLAVSTGDTTCAARRLQVEKPNAYNSLHFAGVVAARSHGVTGPCWVEINRPGSVCNIYTQADCDENAVTPATAESGQMLTFTTDCYSFRFAGLSGSGSAIVLGDVDRSSTGGVVMAELLTGTPSGGVQEFVMGSINITRTGYGGTSLVLPATNWISGTATGISSGGSVYTTPAGVTFFNSFTLAVTVTISTALNKAKGRWVGQTKVFRAHSLGVGGADNVQLTLSTVQRNMTSLTTGIGILPTECTVSLWSSVAATIGPYQSMTFVWTGSSWLLTCITDSLTVLTT